MSRTISEQIASLASESKEALRTTSPGNHSSEIERLRADLDSAKRKWSTYNVINRAGPPLSLILSAVLFAFFILSGEATGWLLASVFYAIVAVSLPILNFGEVGRAEIETLETEIILRTTGAVAIEQRAERLFKSHEIDLRRYYQQTLRHSNVIFFAGVGCMAIGFGIIGYCLYVFSSHTTAIGTEGKVILAAFGVVSGILTNFIAIIYLKIFSEVIKSIGAFHGKLVTTNHLHFANLLLSKVAAPEIRDSTLSQLALRLGAPDSIKSSSTDTENRKENANG